MSKGSVGVNTSTIINTRYRRKRKAISCNCKTCKSGRVVDGVVYCMLTGDVDVKKRSCKYYSGPYVYRPKKYKHKQFNQSKKAKRKPTKARS